MTVVVTYMVTFNHSQLRIYISQTQYTNHIQIQDYYVLMKLNDRNKSVIALYRLFLVSYMLRNVKIEGMGLPHDYPKMMLCQMLAMSYWSEWDLPVWRLMLHFLSVFNEEMGEAYYSVLSRCVLGDNIKSDFDHMNKIFTLLPLYKQIKDDLSADVDTKKFSLTWHHNVKVDAEEITATSFFFNRVINQIVNGTYRSYAYTTQYSTVGPCLATRTTEYVPLVYKTNMSAVVDDTVTKVRKALSKNFMGPHVNDWPFEPTSDSDVEEDESKVPLDDSHSDDQNSSMEYEDRKHGDADSEKVWGPPWTECVVGRFAVLRCLIGVPPTVGICVVKITRKDAEDLSGLYPVRILEGREYLCTHSNIHPRCVRSGKWNWHRTKSTEEEYDNDSVIMYFDKLNDGALPPQAMQAVDSAHTKNPFWQESQLDSP